MSNLKRLLIDRAHDDPSDLAHSPSHRRAGPSAQFDSAHHPRSSRRIARHRRPTVRGKAFNPLEGQCHRRNRSWSRRHRLRIQAMLGATDRHTLLVAPSGVVTVTPAMRQVPYNAEDLVRFLLLQIDFLAVVGSRNIPIRSLADLIAAARRDPALSIGSPLRRAPAMAFGEFVRKNQLDMVFVPYKGGPDAVRDLSESRISGFPHPPGRGPPAYAGRRLRLIAITNPEPAPIAPDVPTALGTGHPELVIQGVIGFLAPRSIPDQVQRQISGDVQTVANDPEIRSRLEKAGQIARGSSPEDYGRYLDEQRQHWDRVARYQRIEN